MIQDQIRVEQARQERIPRADLGNGYFRNPIMVGPGSDNTILRIGSDFYMMAGGGWPDQLVWHSHDLVNWRPLTRALRKYAGRAWASDLVHHQGRFYIYTTQVSPDRGDRGDLNLARRSLLGQPRRYENDKAFMNVVLWADDPAGPWSDPIDLKVYGLIDPGHIVDENGGRHLYFSKGMTIPLSPDGLSAVGELKQVYNGWDFPDHWLVEGHCLEAPKLMFRGGWYYMACAQGGTGGPAMAHMEVVARSRSVEGPWENSPYNPMIRTASRHEKWWRQGHATFVDDVAGNWWFLYTGYENGFTEFNKQSLLLPMEWTTDGWPRIVPGVSATDIIPMPAGENVGHGMPLSDDFASTKMGIQWQYSPEVSPVTAFRFGGGSLIMQAGGKHAREAVALSVMPVSHAYEAQVEVAISGDAEGGLLLVDNRSEAEWAAVGARGSELRTDMPVLENHLPYDGGRLFVRIRNDRHDVSLYHSQDGGRWTQFPRSTELNNGRRLSLYAAGEGEVTFRDFRYRGLD